MKQKHEQQGHWNKNFIASLCLLLSPNVSQTSVKNALAFAVIFYLLSYLNNVIHSYFFFFFFLFSMGFQINHFQYRSYVTNNGALDS
jgi:hypothetical protein